MRFRCTDLPPPVLPTSMECPTLPTWRLSLKGVLPVVWVYRSDGPFSCLQYSSPDQILDSGIICTRLPVETRGRLMKCPTLPGMLPIQASTALSPSDFAVMPSCKRALMMILAFSSTTSASSSRMMIMDE